MSDDLESVTVSNLPHGWRWVSLGDVCKPVRGVIFSSGDVVSELTDGYIACLTTSAVQSEVDWNTTRYIPSTYLSNNEQMLMAGDVLVSTANSKALVGKCCLVHSTPFPCTFGAFVTVLRPNEENIASFVQMSLRMPTSLAYFYKCSSNTTGISNLRVPELLNLKIPLPPLPEQKRIAAILTEQMAEVERARAAAEAQWDACLQLIEAYLAASLTATPTRTVPLKDCLLEVSKGIGASWCDYPLLGVSRAGLAPPKEKVGKNPERYKLVSTGTIFYNPMRILLGSIGLIDEDDQPGITSPDYVVFTAKEGILHYRWFYYWLRSSFGETFIKSMARGAVRERMLFKRLAEGDITLPAWDTQVAVATKLKEVNRLRQIIAQQLEYINRLPAVLLAQAFAGKV